MRADGTTFHIVEYNPNTGSVNKKYTYQGHADGSTWARGQAWALAGFAMLANATAAERAALAAEERAAAGGASGGGSGSGKQEQEQQEDGEEFLAVARRLADKYLELLGRQPAKAAAARAAATAARAAAGAEAAAGEEAGAAAWLDGFVPQWDFDAPFYPEMDGPRDTSGAAVAALGLLYLAEGEARAAAAAAAAGGAAAGTPGSSASSTTTTSSSTTCASRYLCAAVATLRALSSAKYLSPPSEASAFPALLRHATGGFPLRNHVDVGLISGDYYFLAALRKCLEMPACAASAAAEGAGAGVL